MMFSIGLQTHVCNKINVCVVLLLYHPKIVAVALDVCYFFLEILQRCKYSYFITLSFYCLLCVLQAIEKTIFHLLLRNVPASHVSSMISVLIFPLIIRRHVKRCFTGGKVRNFIFYFIKVRIQ